MSSFDRGGSVLASAPPLRLLPGPRISSRTAQTCVRCSRSSTRRHWCCIGSTTHSIRIGQGRYLAENIAGAKFVELLGEDHLPFAGDTDTLLGEIEEFLTGTRGTPNTDRALATILFTDIVESTKRAAHTGDRRLARAARQPRPHGESAGASLRWPTGQDHRRWYFCDIRRSGAGDSKWARDPRRRAPARHRAASRDPHRRGRKARRRPCWARRPHRRPGRGPWRNRGRCSCRAPWWI